MLDLKQAQHTVKTQDTDASSSRRLKAVLELAATLTQQERLQAAATALVTEMAVRFGCDRVSLGFKRRRRIQLQTISHTAYFHRKTNLVRAIEAAMDEALDQKAVVNFPKAARADDRQFRITRAHAELRRQYGSDAICSIPLITNDKVSGVLTLERAGRQIFDDEVVEISRTALTLASPYFHLKRRDERWLISVAWESFVTLLRRLLGKGHLAWKVAGIGLASVVLFFCFATGSYRVTAKTVLESSIQRATVAPFDGYIEEAPFRAGDVVRKGDVLCRLEEREYKLEYLKWNSQHEQLVKQHQQALGELDAAQVKIISAQIHQAKHQMNLIQDHLDRTTVVAPFDGVVVTGDLSQSIGAPAERGDVLFEIAPLDSYRVVLEVDERDVAEVHTGQKGHAVLSAFPGERHALVVKKVTPVSETEEGRNYFRVEAELEATPDGRLRPGMEGVGKIEVERRLLIWIWTHKALDWLRLKLWSWSP